MDTTNNYKETQRKLIEESRNFEERLASPEETWNMQGDITKALLWDMAFSPVEDKKKPQMKTNIQKYILPFPKRKDRKYDPELESVRESMEGNDETWNKVWMMKDIDYIIDNYKNLLSFDDMLVIQTMLVSKYVRENNLDSAMSLLENIKHYETAFNQDQRKNFLYALGIVYFYKAAWKDAGFYKKALVCFDEILWPDLDDEKYLDILSKKIYALFKINDYDNCLSAIEEFLPLSEDTEHIDKDIKTCRIDSFQIQGAIYESKKEYKKAIKSFMEYLKYKPDDENIKKYIRILSEKEWE